MWHGPDEPTNRDFIGLGIWDVIATLHRLERKIDNMALDLTQLQADVTADTDTVNSAITLLNTIAQQLRDSIGDPAALDALATTLEQNTTNLAAAVAANTTPPAPAPAAPAAPVSGLAPPDAPIVAPPTLPEVADPTNLNNTPAAPAPEVTPAPAPVPEAPAPPA